MCDNSQIRKQFPAIANHPEVIYFDNAASTQKPETVLRCLTRYNQAGHANIHRGAYRWSVEATEAYEQTRKKTAAFLHAAAPEQIIFTAGTTAGINLVASTYGRANIKAGDKIVVSLLEHHSNFVPWQQLAEQTGAELIFLNIDEQGALC